MFEQTESQQNRVVQNYPRTGLLVAEFLLAHRTISSIAAPASATVVARKERGPGSMSWALALVDLNITELAKAKAFFDEMFDWNLVGDPQSQ